MGAEMTKINMAELLADREAGTEGPWTFPKSGFDGSVLTHLENGDGNEVLDVDHWAYLVISDADQRRIARLPDLEAAYIEAVEIVKALMDTLPPVATDEKLAAVGRAKVFLADNK